MNIFSSFTFGSLIKTFIPGFICCLALVLIEQDIAQVFGYHGHLWTFVKSDPSSALLLSIPAAIFLGVMSNSLVFALLLDSWIRTPFNNDQSEKTESLRQYDDKIKDLAHKHFEQTLSEMEGKPVTLPKEDADTSYLLLKTAGVAETSFVREQYWYYMEFQLNSAVALCLMAAGLAPHIWNSGLNLLNIILATIALWFAAWLFVTALISAAQRNYSRHIGKMASLHAASLAKIQQDKTAGDDQDAWNPYS